MSIREWVGDNIIYRFFGCFYARFHDHIFLFIRSKTPREFLGRKVVDLGCGDGTNTIRIKKIFQTRDIIGYDSNEFLLARARKRGIKVEQADLNKTIPKGEMATFTFSLHHLRDKEKVLKQVKKNFDFIFLCEPCNDLWHRIFDTGNVPTEEQWIAIFDKILPKHKLYKYKNNLIVFYSSI